MNKFLMVVAVGSALAGCGGNDEPQLPCPAAAVPPIGMAAYASTWTKACNQNRVETMVILATPQNAVNITTRTDFYASADCSGPVLGSINDSAVVTATASGVVQTSLVLTPGGAPMGVMLDQVTLSSTASTKAFTGPWELKQTTNGVRELCLKVTGGVACAQDPGTVPASSGTTAYLYKSGDTMYRVALSGTSYSVLDTFTRPYTLPPAYSHC